MNIMMGINDTYVFPTKVMLTSLCENNKFERHCVYILYDKRNLKTENIKNIQLLERQYDIIIYPIEIDANLFNECPTAFHLSVETYFRFMAQEVLPRDVERVLWLDADMIIINSIKNFYYQDFQDKSIVVCRTNNPNANDFLKRLELDESVGYFNAGMILFDLKSVRKKINTKTYFDCLEKNREKIVWLDQDILNVVFANDKKILNEQLYNYTFFSDTFFSRKDYEEIKHNVYILHYVGAEKPWHTTYQNRAIKFFRIYARKQESFFGSLKFDVCHLFNQLLRKL